MAPSIHGFGAPREHLNRKPWIFPWRWRWNMGFKQQILPEKPIHGSSWILQLLNCLKQHHMNIGKKCILLHPPGHPDTGKETNLRGGDTIHWCQGEQKTSHLWGYCGWLDILQIQRALHGVSPHWRRYFSGKWHPKNAIVTIPLTMTGGHSDEFHEAQTQGLLMA